MKKLFVLMLAVLALATVASAQIASVYSLNYYSNRNNSAGADQVWRVINPGTAGSLISANHGTVCADVFVFDSNQEMIECCQCRITANGMLSFSVLNNLTQNPLTGFPAPNNGVIKTVADDRANCNAESPAPGPTDLLLSFGTHIQQPVTGTFVTTETGDGIAPLAADELAFLGQACSFVHFLGSGKGVCTCPVGG